MAILIGNDWDKIVGPEQEKPYYQSLRAFLKQEYAAATIYPSMENIFAALKACAYEDAKVVILGQDPYINPGEAHGMAFSVLPGAKMPPSLRNIFKEIQADLGCFIPNNGYLMPWALQGVLLLNTVLTVRSGESKSHGRRGWEQFTDHIIRALSERERPLCFMLWGKVAQEKIGLIHSRHKILTAAHPSPLARGGFEGCRHFSLANSFLEANGERTIDWQIPDRG